MKYSVILSVIGSATVALGHGLVSQLEISGTLYDNYSPYVDPYMNPKPERIGWTTPSNGPVEDVTTAGIACNTGSTPGAISAPAAAGSQVKFFWTVWAESHRGPTMTYLAKCPDTDCTTADPTALDWFKIDHAGLNADGTWISDTIIANNNTHSVTIPSDIAPGPYLMRHELLALHAAENVGGAQFYPMCANLQITGSGSAVPSDTVKFPGGYSPTDPGILLSIYWPIVTSYTIPGPAPYVSGESSAPSSAVVVVPTTSSAAPSVAAATSAIIDASSTTDSIATSYRILPSNVPIGTGPATLPPIPTHAPFVIPPYLNKTHTNNGKAPIQTPAFKLPEVTQAPATTAAPVTVTETSTSTIEKTVVLTFTASAIETVTVTEEGAAGCTPVGRYRRGAYLL